MKQGDLVLKANMWDVDGNPIGFGHSVYKIDEIEDNIACVYDYPHMDGFYIVDIKDLKLYI